MSIASTKSSARAKFPREIWVLVGASFLIAVGYGLVAPALPSYATSFDVGVTAASVVISAFAAMRLLFAPVSGRLVTRFGERPVYLWGLAIVAGGSLACAVVNEYWQLLLFRSLSGIGSTMFTVSAVGLLIRIAPPELRGRASGLWGTGFLLGSVAGPVLGGGLVEVSLRAPFVVYGVALIVVTVLVWAQLRNSGLASRADAEEAPEMTFMQALRHPAYRAALSSNFANGWLVFGVRTSLIPLFVVAVLHQPTGFTGIALAVFAAANALVLTMAGRLADTRGRKPLAVAGMGLLAVGTIAIGLTGELWLFILALVLTGVGAGALNPAQTAAVADVLGAKARGGAVLAGFQMAADVGAVLGPLVAGVLAEQLSYPIAFVVTGVIGLIALVMWLLASETLPAKEGDREDEQHTAQDAAACDCCPDPVIRTAQPPASGGDR
ncbi:MFS transporter [Amycolatopsis nigrescens]|uniref:MFS transporter n=1 Tax=Amycolatopsis nigrescens TaxID=381445 RepID=UPI000378F846|nr:MFS transporter [Amycolatopsis nigrescens]